MPYVNGTLYSLLSNAKIAQAAKSMNLASQLERAIQDEAGNPNADTEAKRQISYVLQQYEESSLSSGGSSDMSSLSSGSLSDDGFEEDEESIVTISDVFKLEIQAFQAQLHRAQNQATVVLA